MKPTDVAQRILDGRWRHADAARVACREGTWGAFVRSIAPERPSLVGRFDHGRCLSLAESSLVGPSTTTVTLVPLWACSTEDATSTAWVAVHAMVTEDGLGVCEVGPFIDEEDASPRTDAIWDVTVRRWTAATVVTRRAFSPEIPMRLRAGEFAVYDIVVDEVLSVTTHPSKPLPRPTREVPMFASWLAPRVLVSAELEAQIAAMCFTAEDEA